MLKPIYFNNCNICYLNGLKCGNRINDLSHYVRKCWSDNPYKKLYAIDPSLVGENRYNEDDSIFKKIIKNIYHAFLLITTKSSKIHQYKEELDCVSFSIRWNEKRKRMIDLLPNFFPLKEEFSSLEEIHRYFLQLDNDPFLAAQKGRFIRFLQKEVGSDADLLIKPEYSLLIKPFIDNAQLYNPLLMGIGSNRNEDTAHPSKVVFPVKKGLLSAVPFCSGMIDETAPHMQKWRAVGPSDHVQMVPTKHSAHTVEWRKKLICAAQHNIVISGNYCGDKVFDETLELIKGRLEENTSLKVVIISHPRFVKNRKKKQVRNLLLIKELQTTYPDRFSIVYSDDIELYHGKDGFKKVTNHVKYTGIDWGRYYIMGGSGIQDRFALSGVDHPEKLLKTELHQQYKKLSDDLLHMKNYWEMTTKKERDIWVDIAEAFLERFYQDPGYSKDMEYIASNIQKNICFLNDLNKDPSLHKETKDKLSHTEFTPNSETVNNDGGFLSWVIPWIFRDMDFVFSDPNDGYSSGRRLFTEMMRLAYRWEALNEKRNPTSSVATYTPQEIANQPMFTGEPTITPDSQDSVTQRIMKESMPPAASLKTTKIEEFEGIEKGSVEMLYQGPEFQKGRSVIARKTLDLIHKAKHRIVFNHMYFVPTPEIMKALKQAAKRGVKIEIITAGVTKDCPNGQLVFGPYNQWHWSHLVASLPRDKQENVEIYLYEQRKKGLHKKVIIVDDTVLAGSSNFGYKSLVTSSDYEVNFIAKSKSFVKETLAICEEDRMLSRKIESKTNMSIYAYFKALVYSRYRHLIN